MTDVDPSDEENRHLISTINLPEHRLALTLLAFTPAYALVGILAVISDEGPHNDARLLMAIALMASIVPVGLMARRIQFGVAWIGRLTRGTGPSALFVMYADLGVAAFLFTFANHETALFGTALFAIASMFVAQFESMRVIVVHVAFCTSVILTLAVLVWNQGHHDLAGVIARVLVVLLVVVGTIGVPRRISIAMQKSFRSQVLHAHRDPLTGLLNRRGFGYWANLLVAGSPTAGFLILDLDHFKAVNDGHGHDVGDTVLRLVARRIEEVVGFRASAVSRSGGEEFAIVVAADGQELTALAEAIRVALYDPRDPVPITVSIGVATGSARHRMHTGADEEATISRGVKVADLAMYAAKAAGRNRVVTFDFADLPLTQQDRQIDRSEP